MLILGVQGLLADETGCLMRRPSRCSGAAVLVRDGELVCAVEQGRLGGHARGVDVPTEAVRLCLDRLDLRLCDVDFIAVDIDEHTAELHAMTRYLDDPASQSLGARQRIAEPFEREFGVAVAHKLRFCDHHLAHAWSAHGASGRDRTLVAVFEGAERARSGALYLGTGDELRMLRDFAGAQSMVGFISNVSRLLGCTAGDPANALALAAQGDPTVYGDLMRSLYQLLPKGHFHLADPVQQLRRMERAGVLESARRQGESFTQRHANIAAALQCAVDEILGHVLGHFRCETGVRTLCMAGELTLDAGLNGRLLQSNEFDEVFVQPVGDDAGCALGAALAVHRVERSLAPGAYVGPVPCLSHLSLGPEVVPGNGLEEAIEGWRPFVTVTPCEDVAQAAASWVAEGAIVGWAQGRSEFGPRPLGHRSILADPRVARNSMRVQQLLKRAGPQRPCHVSIPAQRLSEYLVMPATKADHGFGTFALEVRQAARGSLAAATHVDGTASVHAVDRARNRLFWELLEAFGSLTGVHALLNAPLGQGLDAHAGALDDVLVCLLTSGLDALVMDRFLVRKKAHLWTADTVGRLAPLLPLGHSLVQACARGPAGAVVPTFTVESSRPAGRPEAMAVEPFVWRVLHRADGCTPLDALMTFAGIVDTRSRHAVVEAMLKLWAQRLVMLCPVRAG